MLRSTALQIRNSNLSMRRFRRRRPEKFHLPKKSPSSGTNLALASHSPRFSDLTLEDGLRASSMKTLAGLQEWNLMEILQRWTLQIPQAQGGGAKSLAKMETLSNHQMSFVQSKDICLLIFHSENCFCCQRRVEFPLPLEHSWSLP